MNTLDARARAIEYLRAGQVLSGLENCHVPGLFSLVLELRESRRKGILRVFYVGQEPNQINMAFGHHDFSLPPHNHRQDITLHGLFGQVQNVTVEESGGLPAFEYEFGSALLNGAFSLRRCGRARLSFHSEEVPVGEGSIFLSAEVVHTVIAQSPSAWVVEEGEASAAPSRCFSLDQELILDASGLYKPMDAEALRRVAAEIVEGIA